MHEYGIQENRHDTWLRWLKEQLPDSEIVSKFEMRKHCVTEWALRGSKGTFVVQPDFVLLLPGLVGESTIIIAGEFSDWPDKNASDYQLNEYSDTMVDGLVFVGSHSGLPDKLYEYCIESANRLSDETSKHDSLINWCERFR